MMLTPEHFRSQDAYIRDTFLWLVRHCIPGTGLVGGDVRLPRTELGQSVLDPDLNVHDDGEVIHVVIRQARGITSSGRPIDVGGRSPVSESFPKETVSGADELIVYVVDHGDQTPDLGSLEADDANPSQQAWVQPHYTVSLGVAAETARNALAVARIRRAAASGSFEHDGSFIPECIAVSAHSKLHAGWKEVKSEIVMLAERFAALHRTVSVWIHKAAPRGVDTQPDSNILTFVGRGVDAVDTCAYEILDPMISPVHLFQQIDRVGRRVALALELSEHTRAFLSEVSNVDQSFDELLEAERAALSGSRELEPGADTAESLARASMTVGRIGTLIGALEGKYLDYRINERIDALRFLTDRDGEEFYEVAGVLGRGRRDGALITFTGSDMDLDGQSSYRLVLVGESQSGVDRKTGDTLAVTFQFNKRAGGTEPQTENAECHFPDQRNVGVDFTPRHDVGTINDVNVVVDPGTGFRKAMVFRRVRGVSIAPTPVPSTEPEAQDPDIIIDFRPDP